VVAVVVPRTDSKLTVEQVLKLLDGRIARFKHPKEVVIVEALPKTALGKIRKEDVRKMVAHADLPN
jgi:fatty-acyl-CoA synthase